MLELPKNQCISVVVTNSIYRRLLFGFLKKFIYLENSLLNNEVDNSPKVSSNYFCIK